MSSGWHTSEEYLRQVDTALGPLGIERQKSKIVENELQEVANWGDKGFDLQEFGHVAMVDDEAFLLARYVPGLIYATRGSVSQILFDHQQHRIASIQERIAMIKPDVVLLDYRLNSSGGSPYGTDVVPLLHKLQRTMRVIGFSSNPKNRDKFLDAGADEFVQKADPVLSVMALRESLSKLLSRACS